MIQNIAGVKVRFSITRALRSFLFVELRVEHGPVRRHYYQLVAVIACDSGGYALSSIF